MDEVRLHADVLIIGCGISGAAAALAAARTGLDVILISKSPDPEESNTWYAQGGIVSLGPQDDPDLLRDDIIRTGDGINNPEAVDVLVRESKFLVDQILVGELGIEFSRNGGRDWDYAQEGGHSRRRILHVSDTTGRSIEKSFLAALRKRPNVRLLTGHTSIDLLTVPHHSKDPRAYYREPACLGAYVLENDTRRVRTILARRTVLASGGCGAVFLNTSNPREAIGAGYVMALRAGARIAHMEYIQFHPTVLYHRDADGFLISETVRGEGARLKSIDGRTFMDNLGGLKDLAPRDEVSRAIYEEMIPLSQYLRNLSPVRDRHRPRSDTGRSGGPLLLRRRPGRRMGADLAPRPLRGRRNGLHGGSRGESTGLDLAPGGARLGNTGRPAYRRGSDRSGRFRRERHPCMVLSDPNGVGRPGPDQPGLADDPIDDVELCRHHPHRKAVGAGQIRPRVSPASDRKILPRGDSRTRDRRFTPRPAGRLDDRPGRVGQSDQRRGPFPHGLTAMRTIRERGMSF
jgi:glycine/D-amino acid oxidase-like deaminating enzyme